MEAVNNLGRGCLNKVILVFEEVFWPEEQYTFAYMSETPGEYPMIINLKKSDGLPMLLLMVAGIFMLLEIPIIQVTRVIELKNCRMRTCPKMR
jgi:hypothetical protein